jgi:hypothetical protein
MHCARGLLPTGRIGGGYTRPIIVLSSLLVTQRLKGLCDLDEAFLRLRYILGVFVGVMEH